MYEKKSFVPMPPTAFGAPPMLTLVRDQNGRLTARAGAEIWRAPVMVDNVGATVTLRFPMNQVAFTTVELEQERLRLDHEASEVTAGFMLLEGKRNQEIADLKDEVLGLRDELAAARRAPVVILDLEEEANPSLEELQAAIARLKERVAAFAAVVEAPIALA